MSLLTDISPVDLGLPSRFESYRPGQAEAIDFALSSDARVIAASAPTGIGKSLVAATVAVASGLRAVYLTATKSLQSQIHADFGPIGMKDVRGRSNYQCRGWTNPRRTCEEGEDHYCSHARTPACPSAAAVFAAREAKLVSTNYAWWLYARQHQPESTSDVGLLICDEAHRAPDELASFLTVTCPRSEYGSFVRPGQSGLMSQPDGRRWIKWAEERHWEIVDRIKRLRAAKRAGETHDLEMLDRRLSAILRMTSNWVWEATETETRFEPVSVAPYAHILWDDVPRVLLLSATLRPYTLELLGLDPGDSADCEFREFDNGWPAGNAPVYTWPTCRLNHASTEGDYRKLVDRIDEIIESRSDRRGIIHTVSYPRMRIIRKMSRFSRRMFTNETAAEAMAAARRFRESPPPAVLVSPSFASGWDFAYSACEYQICPKVPYPPTVSRVMKERLADSRYRNYLTMMELTQMIGRGRRAADDRCETFLLDSLFPWLITQSRSFAPKRFRAYPAARLPPKPGKLDRKA